MSPSRLSTSFLVLLALCFIFSSVSADTIQLAYVSKVIDGDTIRLINGQTVRYAGIDAPEIDHVRHLEDPMGFDALEANRKLVEGRMVRLEQEEGAGVDRYGRLCALVYNDRGECINRLLVAQGLAYVLRMPSALNDRVNLLEAQHGAMIRRIGIWKHLPSVEGPFIGNIKSSRFHLQGCPYGKHTHQANRIRFNTLRDAYWQGYAPCARCLPSPIKKGKRIP
jgi:micrococcal nuclease